MLGHHMDVKAVAGVCAGIGVDHVDLLEVLDVGGCLVEERPEGVARESLVASTPVYGFLRNLVLDDKAVLRGASGPFARPDDQGSRTRDHALPPPDRGLDQTRRWQVFVYGPDVLYPETSQRQLANRQIHNSPFHPVEPDAWNARSGSFSSRPRDSSKACKPSSVGSVPGAAGQFPNRQRGVGEVLSVLFAILPRRLVVAQQINQETAGAEQWRSLAQQLRIDSIRSSSGAGSGHPTSSMSAADLIAVLMSKYLSYDFDDPENPNNDHLIFSKGHASPLLYSAYKAAGAISDEELMTFRRFRSRLQGHPTPQIPWVDVATGSLGQGLPIGVGVALAGKYLDKLPYHVWVLCGDSEMAEGSMWEAFQHASYYKLDNLIAILDMNRLGQTRETMDGWNAVQIDGHDPEQIDQAYARALDQTDAPTLIVAKTRKGRGVSFLEDVDGMHGKPVTEDQEQAALEELGSSDDLLVEVRKPDPDAGENFTAGLTGRPELPAWEVGDEEATRGAYGAALKALGGAREDVVALDGEVSNSTKSEEFAEEFPERYFEMFIAEQQMVAAAVGMSVRHRVPFASSFAAFLSRAYDFIRMAAISGANLKLSGSHAGVSIGEDGPSQ